ncbi:MAG: helix-turn-helix domain-containing protein [Planctomycetaceae bacterium]|nr:helix-turn-helix domain-containing protein [Planctomycetaceae bacterium]
MTAGQTAKILCVSPRTLWTLTREGALHCVRIGRRVLYAPTDIRAFVDRCRQGGDNHQALLEAT